MKFIKLPVFEKDYKRLTADERVQFRRALKIFIIACRRYESDPEFFTWPSSLRFEKLRGTRGIFAITWSFSGPDGRATFSFQTIDGETYVIWRRVGRHDIYKSP